MKFSYNWLREFLPVELAPEELAKHLLMLGFETADIRRTGPSFSGVVVAEILEIQKHPNADRLSLCSVTDGKEKLSVVCGASNIQVGQRVPLARIGAKLAGGKTIERSKIRGVESQGMLCSTTELGVPGDGAGIKILPADTPLGKDAASLMGEADVILDIEITSNRPDCLSPAPPSAGAACPIAISIEDKTACARYIGRYFEQVKVGPSPDWMARRLESLGLRPINSMVDITNYVLLEYGHPLHVFDADKLKGGRIIVRFAKAGEKIKALDGREYELVPTDLVIADAERPVAIAGVMGGEETGVTEKSTRVLLESAQFSAASVRRTSQRLKLRSDASYRFERGSAPQSAALASARAAMLIEPSAASAGQALLDVYPAPPDPVAIFVSLGRIEQILGVCAKPGRVEEILRALSEKLVPVEGGWSFVPPAHRLDLRTVSDVAEEVARHLGYETIGSEAAPVKLQRPKSLPLADSCAEARRKLAQLGFYEAYAYDFLSAVELKRSGLDASKAPPVSNPLSEDWAFLRPSLVPGLLKAAGYNFRRGARGLKLFELGKVYSRESGAGEVGERCWLAGLVAGSLPGAPDWTEKREPSEPNRHLYESKGALAQLLDGCSFEWSAPAMPDPLFHPKAVVAVRLAGGEVGRVGLVHPSVLQAWELPPGAAVFALDLDALAAAARAAAKLRPPSPFPSIVRDLSITAPESTRYADIEGSLRGLPALARLELIDRMSGEAARSIGLPAGRASFTLRLTFSLAERTLRDEEVNDAVARGLAALKSKCGAELRS